MMSTTTTSHVVLPQTVLRALDNHDQNVPHRPAHSFNARPDLSNNDSSSNSIDWPTQHRGVPPRKPINRSLDMTTRPGGANIAEQIFIATLLNGVRLNANANRLWRASGGKVNKTVFRYDIGGEW